jgi:hypothetical protein
MNKPRTHFDLTREHLSKEGHYVPPKTRDPQEAARRRGRPRGTLIAEQQARGLGIAHNILGRAETGKDMEFTTRMLGMAVMNSSWYVFGKDANDVMRRRLWLPKMADSDTDWRQTPKELHLNTVDGLVMAQYLSEEFAHMTAQDRVTETKKRALGRHLGNMALNLAVLGDGRTVMGGNAHEVQDQARERSLELMRFARQFGIDHQTHPSIAQLPDRDSTLGLYWRQEAPDGAYQAYEEATAS